MEQVPETLANATVLDETGGVVPMSRILADRPVVLVFLRHFG